MAKHDTALNQLFAALGDPTRRDILARLAVEEVSVGDLAEPHDMALPTFMGHLKKLEEAGLVASEKRGRTRYCRLQPGALAPVEDWLSKQRRIWEPRLDCFDAHVLKLMDAKRPDAEGGEE